MKNKSFFLIVILIMVMGSIINAQENSNIYTPELLWKLGRLNDLKVSPDGKTLLFTITYYDTKANKGNTDIYTLPVNGGSIKKITETPISEQNPNWRPDGKKIGFLFEDQIWEMNPDGSDKKQISHIEDEITAFVYDPSMNHILYTKDVKVDKTTQDIYPDLPKAEAIITENLMYRHWNIWEDGSYSHIFIADYPDMINTIDIMEGEPYDVPIYPGGSIDEIQFSNDGKKIVYACKKLKGKEYAVSTNSDIYLYDIDKKTTTNLSESNKGYDLNPVFSPDGKYLIWGSMKTPGYESDKLRMILYDLQTNTANDYSSLFEESATNFVFSADSKYIYFISGTKATYQLFVFDIKKKTIKQLTQGRHDYKSIAITSTNRLIGIRESMIEPADIYSIDIKKGIQTRLTSINEEVLKGIASIQVEERWITTTDNKKMLVWVILPPNFQPTKKYPAVLYCQGGPQQAVSQFFSYRWNFQMMASQGYVIVAPNRRGLPTFGEEWNAQISGDYGGQNMKDYLSAIDEIAKEPYIDKSKLGCVGASYGGFSVYWLAGNHEKRFKAFISHCGMFNLESWYGSTEEMFFANYDLTGPYWEPETKKVYNVSPHKFVKNWDTPILIIHGGNDFRIPYTQAMEAFNAAQLQGIPSKFLFFPDETHFVTKPQNAILWQREFMGWLAKWLK